MHGSMIGCMAMRHYIHADPRSGNLTLASVGMGLTLASVGMGLTLASVGMGVLKSAHRWDGSGKAGSGMPCLALQVSTL